MAPNNHNFTTRMLEIAVCLFFRNVAEGGNIGL